MAQDKNPRRRRRNDESAPPPDEPKRRGRKPKQPEATPPPVHFEPLTVTSHRAFGTAKVQNEIFSRFNGNPELARLLLVNPVQAMKEVGVTLSTRLQKHVMHTLQYSPAMDAERKALEDHLRTQIGRKPRPNDPEWVAEFLFGQLGLKPLDTRGQSPRYKTPFDEGMLRVYEKLRPKRIRPDVEQAQQAAQRAPKASRKAAQQSQSAPTPEPAPQPTPPPAASSASRLTLGLPRTAIARLDLDAPLPELPYARRMPKTVDLETLYFYKDSHPLVRDLIRLGIIQRRQFPIQSADAFRKILRGERASPFQRWISSVQFPIVEEEDADEPDR